jgi:3-phosphoshikimate 1-carboxyvinyltransferase
VRADNLHDKASEDKFQVVVDSIISQPFEINGLNVKLPPSKSLFLRYLVYAALAEGESVLRCSTDNLSEDIEDMIAILRSLGVVIKQDSNCLTIRGVGGEFQGSNEEVILKVRLSGVTARFAVALAVLRRGVTIVDGAPSLRKRPIGEIVDAIRQLGVRVDGDSLPLRIVSGGRGALQRVSVKVSGEVSSQFISAIMAIGPCLSADGLSLELSEYVASRPYLDMTVVAMGRFGANFFQPTHNSYIISGTGYQARDVTCEADVSAASYFIALATGLGISIFLPDFSSATTQGDVAFIDIAQKLGSRIEWLSNGVLITGPAKGQMHSVPGWLDFSLMPDVAPTLAAIGCFITGGVRLKGLSTLRVKECDRIRGMEAELAKFGVSVNSGEDWLEIGELPPNSTTEERMLSVDTYDDHRMAMSLAVFGALAPFKVCINDAQVVGKTFPHFWHEFGNIIAVETIY